MLPAITKRRRVRRASGGRRGGHVGVRRLVKSRLGRPPPGENRTRVRDGIVPARDFQDALRALDLEIQDADRRELAAAFAPSGDPDAVDYREFLKFVRDAGGHMESTGPSATPRLVDASSKAYDGFYGGASSDDEYDRPRRRNPPRSPVTRQRRTLFQGDSAPETAWRA